MKKIYIGNLDRRTADAQLEQAFAPFGTVRSATIIRDRITGESRGFAFIEMENDQEAAAAIAGLDRTEIDGRTVTVNEARPRANDRRRPGGGRGNAGRPGRRR